MSLIKINGTTHLVERERERSSVHVFDEMDVLDLPRSMIKINCSKNRLHIAKCGHLERISTILNHGDDAFFSLFFYLMALSSVGIDLVRRFRSGFFGEFLGLYGPLTTSPSHK